MFAIQDLFPRQPLGKADTCGNAFYYQDFEPWFQQQKRMLENRSVFSLIDRKKEDRYINACISVENNE